MNERTTTIMRTRNHMAALEPGEFKGAYKVKGYAGIAWRVHGWETEPDEDTEWSGYEVQTGRLICVMIGDDRRFAFEPEELTQIPRASYCGECGQIGCACDGYDRTEEA